MTHLHSQYVRRSMQIAVFGLLLGAVLAILVTRSAANTAISTAILFVLAPEAGCSRLQVHVFAAVLMAAAMASLVMQWF